MSEENENGNISSATKQDWRWRGRTEQQIKDIQKSVDEGKHEVVELGKEHRSAVKEIGTQIQLLQLSIKAMVTKWVMVTGFIGFIATSLVAYVIAKYAK
jgi:hypothetical protein